MSPLQVGSTSIVNAYHGSSRIVKAYLGATHVFTALDFLGPITIGAATDAFSTHLGWGQLQIPNVFIGAAGASPLFADQTTPYWFRRLQMAGDAGSWGMNFSRSETESQTDAGPDLVPRWETFGVGAWSLILDGVVYAFQGPAGPDAGLQDTTEPYGWNFGDPADPDRLLYPIFRAAYDAADATVRAETAIAFSAPVS